MSILASPIHLRSLLVLGVMPWFVPTVAALVVAALAVAVFALTTVDDDRSTRAPISVPPVPPALDELASTNDVEVIAAIDQFAKRGQRVPSLVLYHPSPLVVRHALRAIGPSRDLQRVLPYLRAHRDADVRDAARAL